MINLRLGVTPGVYTATTFADDATYRGMFIRGVARTFHVDEGHVFVVGPHRRSARHRFARRALLQGDPRGEEEAAGDGRGREGAYSALLQDIPVTVGVMTSTREAAEAMVRDALPQAVPDPTLGPLLRELWAQGLVDVKTLAVASTNVAAPPPPPLREHLPSPSSAPPPPPMPPPEAGDASAGAGDYVRVVTKDQDEDAHVRELETSFVVAAIAVPTVGAVALGVALCYYVDRQRSQRDPRRYPRAGSRRRGGGDGARAMGGISSSLSLSSRRRRGRPSRGGGESGGGGSSSDDLYSDWGDEVADADAGADDVSGHAARREVRGGGGGGAGEGDSGGGAAGSSGVGVSADGTALRTAAAAAGGGGGNDGIE